MANLEEMRHSPPKIKVEWTINIVTIGWLFLQTLVLVSIGTAWKAEVENRLTKLEATDQSRDDHTTRLTIIEQKFGFIEQSLRRQEALLEKVTDKLEARQ